MGQKSVLERRAENTHSLQERWNHWSVKYGQWIIAGAKGTLWLQEHNYSKLPPRQNFSLRGGSQYFCANRGSSNVEKPYMYLRLYHRHRSHCRQDGEGNFNIGLQHESWLLHCKVKELGAASSCTRWVKMPLICINLHKFHNMNLQCYKHLIHLSKCIHELQKDMLVGRTVQLELLCTVGYLFHPSAGCGKMYLLGTTSSKSGILKSREGRRKKNLQK